MVLGHSERRQYFGETDRALQEKVPAALAAGLQPILCVGETEEERERGETERKLRHQVQEALESVPTSGSREVVIAYEPIWAIGTGQVATPEQAQEAIAFVRALVGDRSEEAAERTACSTAAASSPTTPPRSWPSRTWTARSWAARAWIPRRSRRSWPRPPHDAAPGPGAPPVPSVCLVVLDGWGLAEPGPGNAVELADTPVFDELWAGTRTPRSRPGARPWACPRARWATPRWATSTSAPGAVVKQDITRIDEAVEDGSFFENEALRAACARRARRPPAPARAGLRRAACTRAWSTCSALVELARRERRARHGAARLHRRPRHAPRLRRRLPGRGGARWERARGSATVTAATSRWTATGAGTARKRAWDALVHGEAESRGGLAARRRCAPPTSAARPTSSSSRRWSATRARIRDGDAVVFFNFRPDRARQLTRALGEDDFAEFDRGERPHVALTTLTSYQEDWDYPVAFPPAPARRHARLGARRARRSRSCTWPRPRSTRT